MVFALLLHCFPRKTSPSASSGCYSHSAIGHYTSSPIGPYTHAFIGSHPIPTTYINLGFLFAHTHSWTDQKKGSTWILKRRLIVLNWHWQTAQGTQFYIVFFNLCKSIFPTWQMFSPSVTPTIAWHNFLVHVTAVLGWAVLGLSSVSTYCTRYIIFLFCFTIRHFISTYRTVFRNN
jgi:hypothetical protein